MSDFKKKYDFSIKGDLLPVQNLNTSEKNDELINNSILKVNLNEKSKGNQDSIISTNAIKLGDKKDILLSKPYPEILRRKIILNINLLKVYINNFYYEEFDYSRRSLYFSCSVPILTYLLMTFQFSDHPLKRTIIVFNALFSSGVFLYFYHNDMINCANQNTELGIKV